MLRVSIALFLASITIAGWVLNVVQIIHHASDPITALFVIKCVGIAVVPLGAVCGWCGV